ncbi:MAG: peptide-methionine (S)-S-oxide reductase MsrA [Candidatus Nitrotoga sp.]
MEQANFAAGCFWGVEAAFRLHPGVLETSVGYTDGNTVNPTYPEVCTGNSGHAEAVQITFDPAQVSYTQLLDIFWQCHDPTQRNRQGPDVGTQYRSAIFFHSPQQETAAIASKSQQEKSGRFVKPIATEIVAASAYYLAEDYHQQYLEKRGQAHCH